MKIDMQTTVTICFCHDLQHRQWICKVTQEGCTVNVCLFYKKQFRLSLLKKKKLFLEEKYKYAFSAVKIVL